MKPADVLKIAEGVKVELEGKDQTLQLLSRMCLASLAHRHRLEFLERVVGYLEAEVVRLLAKEVTDDQE